MDTPVAVSTFARKSYDAPDERRTPPKTQVDVVHLEGYTLGRMVLQPGWRWSECIKPIAKTDRCQLSHVGYSVSGRLTLLLPDGREQAIRAGELYAIPPGHDAWVEGDEPFVAMELMSAEQFAKG
jgi:hypothetical protein